MPHYQAAIVAPLPRVASHLFFTLEQPQHLDQALSALVTLTDGGRLLVGLGAPLVAALEQTLAGLRDFAALQGAGVAIPATQHALWCWLRGNDEGELLHRTRELQAALAPALRLHSSTHCFLYRDGHDLTGYEDGTENPEGDDALAAAVVGADAGDGLAGGSFAAIQQWQHDLDSFQRLPQHDQDNIIGRRLSDNEELEDAPESAHVKRTAQESFTPEAFMMRRSMPWAEGTRAGLMFLAFGHSTAAFDVQMQRMLGLEDGIVDGLFRFSQPITGGYYWCPPLRDGRLDLRAIGHYPG